MKNKSAPQASAPDAAAPPDVGPQGDIAVEPLLFERLLRHDAELKNAVLTQQLQKLAWEIQVHRQMDQVRTADAQVREANARFAEIVRTVESQYKLRMTDYSMCTETGCLKPMPNP